MALTGEEIDLLAEMVAETPAATEAKADGLSAATEAGLRELLAEYAAVRFDNLKLSGGREGVELDPSETRRLLRRMGRRRLGFPAKSDAELDLTGARLAVTTLKGVRWQS